MREWIIQEIKDCKKELKDLGPRPSNGKSVYHDYYIVRILTLKDVLKLLPKQP